MKSPICHLWKIVVTATLAISTFGGLAATQSAPAMAQPYGYGHPHHWGYHWRGRGYDHRRWHPGYYGPAHRWHAGFWVYF